MVELGGRLAQLLVAGDLVVLDGDLGAGKTTLTRGIGAGMGVRGLVTSPTFVIARRHRGASGRPGLVHVDAYRLADGAELDDLDLDVDQEDHVTVVEWGLGLAERLSPDHLVVSIRRPGESDGPDPDGPDPDGPDPDGPEPPSDVSDGAQDSLRLVQLEGHGQRWRNVDLTAAVTVA